MRRLPEVPVADDAEVGPDPHHVDQFPGGAGAGPSAGRPRKRCTGEASNSTIRDMAAILRTEWHPPGQLSGRAPDSGGDGGTGAAVPTPTSVRPAYR
ncbi:hypothetical protein GCM10027614_05190 [Micromonospora vulcania]